MPRNFYYGKDAAIVAGAANFASLIQTGFASYGLSSAQSTAFQTLNTALQSAYSAAIDPTTRTPVAVQAKNTAIANMRNSAILLSKIVYATATVTDAQLVGLGLLPRSTRSPVPVPTEAPVVEVVSVVGRIVKVRLHDATTPSRRGLPRGAIGANVYSFVGATPPADPNLYHFEGMTTRATATLQFPDDTASGATAWLSARWVSARGYTSYGSAPISFTIQGGAVVATA